MVKKTIDIKVKASLQLLSRIRKIDFKCPKGYRPSAKKEKNKASWEYQDRDKDKDKAKLHNPLFANTNQLQI